MRTCLKLQHHVHIPDHNCHNCLQAWVLLGYLRQLSKDHFPNLQRMRNCLKLQHHSHVLPYYNCLQEWVLLDYKVSRELDSEALTDRYFSQLKMYALALERITGMPVKEIRLCLLLSGEHICVDVE